MKKIAIVAIAAITMVGFSACGNKAKKSGLNSDIDSLSYAIGVEQAQGIQSYFQQQELDSANINEFLKGFEEATKQADDKKKNAYNNGISVGVQIARMQEQINQQLFGDDSTQSINSKQFAAGFKDAAKGKGGKMTLDQARMLEQVLVKKIQDASAEKLYGKNKKAGAAFMANIAKQAQKDPKIKKLGQGVYYKVITEGKGAVPTAQQMVKVIYEGKTIDGKVFDSTAKHGGEAMQMPVGGVIPGFTEALTHMPTGSTWEIYIPAEAAYGSRKMGNDIEPFSTLIFKVTLVEIVEQK